MFYDDRRRLRDIRGRLLVHGLEGSTAGSGNTAVPWKLGKPRPRPRPQNWRGDSCEVPLIPTFLSPHRISSSVSLRLSMVSRPGALWSPPTGASPGHMAK